VTDPRQTAPFRIAIKDTRKTYANDYAFYSRDHSARGLQWMLDHGAHGQRPCRHDRGPRRLIAGLVPSIGGDGRIVVPSKYGRHERSPPPVVGRGNALHFPRREHSLGERTQLA
jgi:hypothetical protein